MKTVRRVGIYLLTIAVAVTLLGPTMAPTTSQASVAAFGASESDWAQVQKNPQRTGFSSETLGTNFQVAWTRAFQPERVHPQVQAIVHLGLVFAGTESGALYALDAKTGAQRWAFRAGGPIVSSVAADSGRVFLGAMDGAVYGLDAMTGGLLWKQQLARRHGFSTAPIVADGRVMLGGRDGRLYALDPATGSVVWSTPVGAPILQTAAANGGKVYFGAMDLRVHALNTSDGSVAWTSERLKGTALKDYWPVVHKGKVIVTPMADRPEPGIRPSFPFDWGANWSWLGQYGPLVAAGRLTEVPDAMRAQDSAIAAYGANPGAFSQSLYVLDEATGKQAMAVPHFATQTMHGATTPPTVDRDGYLVVPLMFVKSGWGRLDLDRQRIVDVLYDGRDRAGQPFSSSSKDGMPAGFGNADENLNISAAGNLVLGFHTQEGNANYTGAFDLGVRRWTEISQGWRNGQTFNNNQGGGGNPASIADGMIYHISVHELVARSTQ